MWGSERYELLGVKYTQGCILYNMGELVNVLYICKWNTFKKCIKISKNFKEKKNRDYQGLGVRGMGTYNLMGTCFCLG